MSTPSSELAAGLAEADDFIECPERMVTVWCPDWAAIAAGCSPDEPAAIMRAHRVTARTPAAAAEGIIVGHRRRQAQQRCPEVQLFDDDPARSAREFEPVVRSVAELAPRVDLIEPGWLSFAARGPSRYFGGDEALAQRLGELVTDVLRDRVAHGTSVAPVGVGVADGRFAASVAARLAVRRSAPVIVEPGGSSAFCAPLPVGWLQTLGEVEAELTDMFVRLGLRRLGDVAGLDPADVLGRFGRPGAHARRLAAGADHRPANTTDPSPERRLTRVLDDPVAQADAVVFVAKQLADRLADSLAADGRVCTRLVVVLETEHGERSERSWYRSAGMSAPAMVERVRWQLDAWVNLPRGSEHEISGGVHLVRLTPEEVRADDGEQLGLWGGQSDADRRAIRSIARLTTLTSETDVTVPVWHGGRLPADRYRWMPATLVDLDQRAQAVTRSAAGDRVGPWPGSIPPPSPSTVFAEPRRIEVVDVEGANVAVSGRGMVSAPPSSIRFLLGTEAEGWRRGRSRSVQSWAGPWPVDQCWWEPGAHRRLARFQVVVEGEGVGDEAFLIVAEHQQWYVLAAYH
ncbi:MAG: DNA polymerase Y family protein [Ilumatobacter sp.]